MRALVTEPSRRRVGPPAKGDLRPGPGAKRIYLLPGQIWVSAEPAEVSTILGSCVAVCLWDSVLRAGGVNHFLLPFQAGAGQASTRLGTVATERLVEGVLGLGGRRRNLEAKIFGGARVFVNPRAGDRGLGAENVDLARRILAREGIPVVAEDVGGDRGRKLVFRSDDGAAWVRKFKRRFASDDEAPIVDPRIRQATEGSGLRPLVASSQQFR